MKEKPTGEKKQKKRITMERKKENGKGREEKRRRGKGVNRILPGRIIVTGKI